MIDGNDVMAVFAIIAFVAVIVGMFGADDEN